MKSFKPKKKYNKKVPNEIPIYWVNIVEGFDKSNDTC